MMNWAYLFRKHSRLSRNVKPFPAPHILASHHVVFPHHVRPELGKARPVALVGPSRQLTLFGTHDPRNFILRRLVAMRTIQRRRLLFLLLVKEISLFHVTNYCIFGGAGPR